MTYTDEDQTTALSAIFQSTGLVNKLATTGHTDEFFFETCINSLFILSPDSVGSIYPKSGLQFGFKLLKNVLTFDRDTDHHHILQYALTLIKLGKKMNKNDSMQDYVRQRIKQIARQKKYLAETKNIPVTDSSVIASLATLYQETISTLAPRIQVIGQPQYLQNEMNANRVRALLLTGIRATILWYQTGGRSWNLLLPHKRRKMLNTLDTQITDRA